MMCVVNDAVICETSRDDGVNDDDWWASVVDHRLDHYGHQVVVKPLH